MDDTGYQMLQAEPVEATEAPGLLTLHPDDDVAVALRPLEAGERLEVEIAEAIPRGHKVALREMAAGAEIRKYGWPIGRLTAPVGPGEHVHSHNLATLLTGVEGYDYSPAPPIALPCDGATRFISNNIALGVWRALCSSAGGDSVEGL